MEIHCIERDGAAVISVRGEVDLYSSPRLRKEIVDNARNRISSLVIDLGAVTYMDSSGIATLVEGLQLTKRYGGRFRLVQASPSIKEVLKFARLDRIFSIYDTVEEALEFA